MTEIKCGRSSASCDETMMYAAVVRFADGSVMRNNLLFTSPEDARRCMNGMEEFLHGKNDNEGAITWGSAKFCVFPVKVCVPEVIWEAES